MQILNCPSCAKNRISIKQKLDLTVDGRHIECGECGVVFGVFVLVRLIIGITATAMFFFSFAYFFGSFGFLSGLLLSVITAFAALIFLSVICPLFKMKT